MVIDKFMHESLLNCKQLKEKGEDLDNSIKNYQHLKLWEDSIKEEIVELNCTGRNKYMVVQKTIPYGNGKYNKVLYDTIRIKGIKNGRIRI